MTTSAASATSPIISDRDVILGFADRVGVKYHAAKEAMRRLVDGKANDADRMRLIEFVQDNDNRYPITCDALGRVLNGRV